MDHQIEKLVIEYCLIYNVPILIMFGLIMAESSGNVWATRYEPNYNHLYKPEDFINVQTLETEVLMQKTSIGLTQIMGATARYIGYNKEFLSGLYDPQTNINYGTKYLRMLYDEYKNWKDAVAAYNSGTPIKIDGEYINQDYVDKVFNYKGGIK